MINIKDMHPGEKVSMIYTYTYPRSIGDWDASKNVSFSMKSILSTPSIFIPALHKFGDAPAFYILQCKQYPLAKW